MGLIRAPGRVSGGQVLFDGTDLRTLSASAMRAVRGKQIAMTMQDALTALNPGITIGGQLIEVILAHNTEVAALPRWQRQREARNRALEMLNLVGIPLPQTRLQDYPHQFSGGMRQRVVIAMAIANSPKVLIADEPTTALDVTVQAQILEVIQKVQKQFGTAVVLITHDLGVVARVCDRVNVMYAGRFVERAAVTDLFDAPTHPYTRGLLASLPQAGKERLVPIVGFPPNMLRPPSGCAFRARCADAVSDCEHGVPELRAVGAAQSACIRAAELMQPR
jgi:peptide/nickel transport system ATP-binding protein/oligopeptide transport system ATP-binding protein